MRSLLLLAAAFMFLACERQVARNNGLRQTLDAINKKCPAMIDPETRLDSVWMVNEKTLRYSYSLVNSLARLVDTAEFRRALWPGLLSTVKLSEEMAPLREQSITIQYEYADGTGKKFYLFSIAPKDYLEQ